MSLRRLHHDQPKGFAFTPANQDWAEGQIGKYPEGRQASAVIPLLWRGQEQEGWVSRPMIETVAKMLDMAEIRVLEVATFYFMFHLHPVGSVAHVQVCGTTSCMICGAEDLVAVCRERIAPEPGQLSADGRFSWEEVECLGACSNAPMAQIGKDYFEDLDRESFGAILDVLDRGEVPPAGSRKGRFASEPEGGFTTLTDGGVHEANGSVALAAAMGDSVARIDGTAPTASDILLGRAPAKAAPAPLAVPAPAPAPAASPAQPAPASEAEAPSDEDRPELLTEARGGAADNLQKIKGVGPKLEALLHRLGVFHFAQIASWSEREVAWVDYHLEGFKGRIKRDDWVAQAKTLAAEGDG